MGEHGPALRRFWPVLVGGFVLACVAVFSAYYKVPSMEKRAPYDYTATGRLLVTGAQAPYIRSSVTNVIERTPVGSQPARGRAGSGGGDTSGSAVLQTSTPDLTPYVRAANLYPLLVESDEVRRYRERLFGKTKGIIAASAIYQVATPARFRASEIPVIQVFGTSSTPRLAVKVTEETAHAFIRWIAQQQKAQKVPKAQRILVQELQAPQARTVVQSGGTSTGLLILIFAAVLSASGVLAIVLDRLRPRETAESEPPSEQAGAADAQPTAPATRVVVPGPAAAQIGVSVAESDPARSRRPTLGGASRPGLRKRADADPAQHGVEEEDGDAPLAATAR